MIKPVILAENLFKEYYVYPSKWTRFMAAVRGKDGLRPLRALGPIDLKIYPGEAWGFIGENGAGKSTFLKLVSGVIKPSSGELEVKGRISSILELGMGFHPELTGRQNVILNASLQGLDSKTVRHKIDEIYDFAEIGEYFDLPVKFYSSGMYMRLAFSLAVNVDPDILVIDEVLAVGDGFFVTKCLDKMVEKREQGTTILFVSHSLYSVSSFCHKACWLKDGNVKAMGQAKDIIGQYEQYLSLAKSKWSEVKDTNSKNLNKVTSIKQIELHGVNDGKLPFGASFSVEVELDLMEDLPVYLAFSIDRKDSGIYCYAESMHREGFSPIMGRGRRKVVLNFDSFPLLEGEYKLIFFLMDKTGLGILDQKETKYFKVTCQEKQWGVCYVPHRWEVSP